MNPKYYILGVVIAILATAWLFDRHFQYEAGIAHCTNKQQAAETKYRQGKEKDNQKEKEEIAKASTSAATHINSLNAMKDIEKAKQDALNKANPAANNCDLSNDELLKFNARINSLQR